MENVNGSIDTRRNHGKHFINHASKLPKVQGRILDDVIFE